MLSQRSYCCKPRPVPQRKFYNFICLAPSYVQTKKRKDALIDDVDDKEQACLQITNHKIQIIQKLNKYNGQHDQPDGLLAL